MICKQLREAKDDRKLTNQELSDLSGVPIGTVNRIMSGQTDNPNWQTVCDLALTLGLSLDELVREEATERPGDEERTPGPAGEPRSDIASRNCVPCLRHMYEDGMKQYRRWVFRLFVVCCVLVTFILAILIYDILHPSVGFFQAKYNTWRQPRNASSPSHAAICPGSAGPAADAAGASSGQSPPGRLFLSL